MKHERRLPPDPTAASASLPPYVRAAPKAELHVHLEGSIQPHTLLTLAERNGVSLPASTVEGLREWFRFRDFAHFIEVYVAVTRCLRTAEDYEFVVYEFGKEIARQNVQYAEVTFSPGTHFHFGVPHDVYFPGMTRGRGRVLADFGVELNWVFDIVRDAGEGLADYTTKVAIECRDAGVVALGLGGYEAGHPPQRFARYFDMARKAGLHCTPHAGETDGPASIWSALWALGAERIGHGVRAVEDPDLVAYLAARGIPLEINPTSNIRLGVYPTLAAHPLRQLHDAGVLVTINSDDPALFNTTLNDELATLGDPFGFDVAAIDAILLNGVRHSFLPVERKQALEKAFRSNLDRLRAVHLGPQAESS